MKHKALTAAIAAALAAPVAAQAVDFSISGQVNRALFIVDSDAGTDASVANNTGSSTRIRATGSSEMMDGNTAGIQLEYEESDPSVNLRHANVWFSGEFGKITLGKASEAGDGTVYPDKSGTWGIGVGQLHTSGSNLYATYFASLDAGSRRNLVRYDTPAIGLVSGAVSVANGDFVSAKLAGEQSAGDTTVSGSIAVNMGGEEAPGQPDKPDVTTAALGIGLASGITWSVTWASSNPSEVGRETATYVHTVVGYKFGDSSVGVSYYGGSDLGWNGSESTGIGVGVAHLLPKLDAVVYAGVQQHSVDGGIPTDVKPNLSLDEKGDGSDTVLTIGTRIKF